MRVNLVVTAGPDLDETTHECVHVNSESYVPVSNEHFTGQIAVRVKDFSGLAPEGEKPITQSPYFDDAPGMTFSIEASGIYKTEGLNADDLLFGIVFRHSIVDRLPSSYPLGIKALHWFNPNIDFQLEGERPTVLAPLFSIMSRVNVTPASSISPPPSTTQSTTTPPPKGEDTTALLAAQKLGTRAKGEKEADKPLVRAMLPFDHPDREVAKTWLGYPAYESAGKARQVWFSDPAVRKSTIVGSERITTDLQNGFMTFKDLNLRIPGLPLTVGLGAYMKGRPVQYCCISRDKSKVYWCVVFTILDDDEVVAKGAAPASA